MFSRFPRLETDPSFLCCSIHWKTTFCFPSWSKIKPGLPFLSGSLPTSLATLWACCKASWACIVSPSWNSNSVSFILLFSVPSGVSPSKTVSNTGLCTWLTGRGQLLWCNSWPSECPTNRRWSTFLCLVLHPGWLAETTCSFGKSEITLSSLPSWLWGLLCIIWNLCPFICW